MLESLSRFRAGRTRRASSWDRSGANDDRVILAPGESHDVPRIKGPGVVRHVWVTSMCSGDPLYLRKVMLRVWWDGEDSPSVESPLGASTVTEL